MNDLRTMLNEFYHNIPDWFYQPLISAINAAEEAGEDHVITPLSTFITLLYRGINPNDAVNHYMTDPATRRSVTRRFFFPHTLPGNLYPEDHDIYTYPPAPSPLPQLQPSHAVSVPPRIDSYFRQGVANAIAEMAYQERDPEEAQAPSVIPRHVQ